MLVAIVPPDVRPPYAVGTQGKGLTLRANPPELLLLHHAAASAHDVTIAWLRHILAHMLCDAHTLVFCDVRDAFQRRLRGLHDGDAPRSTAALGSRLATTHERLAGRPFAT